MSMNTLSYILIGIVALWFILALIYLIRRKGNTCACGRCDREQRCTGDCSHCTHGCPGITHNKPARSSS